MSDERIQKKLVTIGVNNNKKIVYEYDFESFSTMDDLEALQCLVYTFDKMKRDIHTQIEEIIEDNTIIVDDEDLDIGKISDGDIEDFLK